MKVTSVNVKKIEKEGSRMKGIASIVLDDCFAVKDIRIIQGEDKLFIAMPSRKYPDGEYRDVAHPINAETREMIEKAIFEAYENAEEAKGSEAAVEEE
jgi:stage V sporulation protein G